MINFDTMTLEQIREYHQSQDRSYQIVRSYFKGGRRVIRDRVTLAEAQAHCHDPETSSSTCASAVGKRRTRQPGPWFDGYEKR